MSKPFFRLDLSINVVINWRKDMPSTFGFSQHMNFHSFSNLILEWRAWVVGWFIVVNSARAIISQGMCTSYVQDICTSNALNKKHDTRLIFIYQQNEQHTFAEKIIRNTWHFFLIQIHTHNMCAVSFIVHNI